LSIYVGAGHARDNKANVGASLARDLKLWNQEGADAGSFLFAGMARSYREFFE